MKTFSCSSCGQVAFFENVRCLRCEHELGFFPDRMTLDALEPAGDNCWRSGGKSYRKCGNYLREDTCNWMVEAGDPRELCRSCRLNHTIPDLSDANNRRRWYRLEVAKRRLIYTLLQLDLPISGLSFDFLVPGEQKVLSGYDDGLITINAVEADDEEREKARVDMGEPYRTLVGHFRHESGHHYWALFVDGREPLKRFRELFGDEREDYAAALKRRYDHGPDPSWHEHGHISSYASVHPWEDWAETWAHYLHMHDTLETARAFNLAVGSETMSSEGGFDETVADWGRLTFAINSINRSMGISDLYPFVLSPQVTEKLRFIHQLVGSVRLLPR